MPLHILHPGEGLDQPIAKIDILMVLRFLYIYMLVLATACAWLLSIVLRVSPLHHLIDTTELASRKLPGRPALLHSFSLSRASCVSSSCSDLRFLFISVFALVAGKRLLPLEHRTFLFGCTDIDLDSTEITIT
jgi:hypothetical protein